MGFLVQFWRPDLTNLQKLISSLFHSVRAFLEPEELKELGSSIASEVMQHFYGVKPTSKGGSSRQTKPGRSAKKP